MPLLGAVSGSGSDRVRFLTCAPGLALAGLALLALAQAAPLPAGALRRVAPSAAALRADVVPDGPARVRGDSRPPVPAPAPAISQHREMTVDAAVRLAAGWVLFQSVLGLSGGWASFRRFGLALAANSTLLALFSLIQSLAWTGKIYWVREVSGAGNGGPFISHSHLAAYLNLGLGFALSFLILPGRGHERSRTGGLRLAAAYASGLIVVGVIASLSRSGLLGMLAGALAMLLASKPRAVSLRTGAGVAAVVGFAGLFLVAVGVSDPYQRVTTFLETGSYAERLSLWGVALRAWSAYPVWGLGLGSFAFAAGRFFGRRLGGLDVFYGHAESEYVEALTEGGVIGLVLLLVAFVSVVGLGRRALGSATGSRQRSLTAGGLFGLVVLAVQSFSDFPMHIPAVAVAAVISAAHLTRAGLDARSAVADGTSGSRGGASGRPRPRWRRWR